MVLDWEEVEGIDPFHASKLLDCKWGPSFAEGFAIVVGVATIELKDPLTLDRSYLARFVTQASWFACANAGCVEEVVRFEQGPQELERDLAMLEKRSEAVKCSAEAVV